MVVSGQDVNVQPGVYAVLGTGWYRVPAAGSDPDYSVVTVTSTGYIALRITRASVGTNAIVFMASEPSVSNATYWEIPLAQVTRVDTVVSVVKPPWAMSEIIIGGLT
jgi:hypothetical protein